MEIEKSRERTKSTRHPFHGLHVFAYHDSMSLFWRGWLQRALTNMFVKTFDLTHSPMQSRHRWNAAVSTEYSRHSETCLRLGMRRESAKMASPFHLLYDAVGIDLSQRYCRSLVHKELKTLGEEWEEGQKTYIGTEYHARLLGAKLASEYHQR